VKLKSLRVWLGTVLSFLGGRPNQLAFSLFPELYYAVCTEKFPDTSIRQFALSTWDIWLNRQAKRIQALIGPIRCYFRCYQGFGLAKPPATHSPADSV
jgi:hypothetical protein